MTSELIIQVSIMDHLERHSVLSDHQHGFRKRRSCETQLIHDLAKCLNDGGQIDAFDKVPHHHLANKLHHKGKRDPGMGEQFSEQPHTRSDPGREKSSSSSVTSRVPQGSVLATILFLCYINNLQNHVFSTDAHCCLHSADDCLIYRNINTTHDADILHDDIDRLQT